VKQEGIRELAEKKSPPVLPDLPDASEGRPVHYAFFARAGFTDAARSPAEVHGVLLVDLDKLDRDLAIEQRAGKKLASRRL
jgi:hypothetical protein